MLINKIDNINTINEDTFYLHKISILRATGDTQSRKSVSNAILDLYFVFILVRAGNAVLHMQVVAIKVIKF